MKSHSRRYSVDTCVLLNKLDIDIKNGDVPFFNCKAFVDISLVYELTSTDSVDLCVFLNKSNIDIKSGDVPFFNCFCAASWSRKQGRCWFKTDGVAHLSSLLLDLFIPAGKTDVEIDMPLRQCSSPLTSDPAGCINDISTLYFPYQYLTPISDSTFWRPFLNFSECFLMCLHLCWVSEINYNILLIDFDGIWISVRGIHRKKNVKVSLQYINSLSCY